MRRPGRPIPRWAWITLLVVLPVALPVALGALVSAAYWGYRSSVREWTRKLSAQRRWYR